MNNTRICRLHQAHDLRIEEIPVDDPARGEVLVRMGAGGICGSDLHYYQHGGFGHIRVREPIILGHEIAGHVAALGADVTDLALGDMVAISPSNPCNNCAQCAAGVHQHCPNMRFLGSARTMPHEQGGYREQMVVGASQCHKMSGDVTLGMAAICEPLAVCLHAGNVAGDLAGKRVLISGAGPIGLLVAAVAKHAGAGEIVITDITNAPFDLALKMGATRAINVVTDPDALGELPPFDTAFECSGAGPAINTAIQMLRPQGTMVQVGILGEATLPLGMIVGKEITLKGTHRFHPEFADAAKLISSRAIDVAPMIGATFDLSDAVAAFTAALDPKIAGKVQLRF